MDADTGEWYFIEVNPRIQVEHTVTEMVTGIDLVRCQIQVAQGLDLHGPEMNLPPQDRVPLYGYALQCRITTEDPSNGFVPDYGKLSTYRSAAGFGIRLDGGSAYSGSVITPYYDSLLVKATAWGREFRHACQRMDRSLREFRMRGVKTNIPFLENVVNHADFQEGRVTTRWLEETPALFRFAARRDRATRLLSYLADVIVNGNPTVAGKPKPRRTAPAPAPPHDSSAPPEGTRQLLQRLGPEGFAQWTAPPEAACCSPTPPSATRTNRCWPRASAPTTCWPSPTSSRTACTISTAWKCGAAPPSTSRCASCTRIPSRGCANCARPFPTSASRCCCALPTPWATRRIPTTWWRPSSRRPPRRASTSSASSIRSTGCPT